MKIKILIVDDEPALLHAMRRDLSRIDSQYELFFTTKGSEASAIILDHEIDLLITDLFMPEKEGIEIIREVKSNHPNVKIITMSGGGKLGGLDYLSMSRDLGSSYSLDKPFSETELANAIEYVMNLKP